MNEIKYRGRARIAWINSDWPLSTLKVNKDRLELNASFLGKLSFQASDILSIVPYTRNVFLGQGIQIIHKVENYSDDVIFWTFKDPNKIICEIEATGFPISVSASSSENNTSHK
ncbi:MAG: hypothetical protein R2852_07435 [Bacteroidia bacterium]